MNIRTASTTPITQAMTADALEARLFEIGAERYHNLHPFHDLLHSGQLNRGQVQAWALNRYCYQAAIPMKDASLMGRIDDRELRREWMHRITDHDGYDDDEGGIMRWLILTDGLGLDRDYVVSQDGALPAVRLAVDAYIRYVREKPLLQAIASSLTELFAPKIHRDRIAGMLKNYDFIDDRLMTYGTTRLNQAPVDADFALQYVRRHALRADQQQDVINALLFKLNVLWIQLDALYLAYVNPGLIAPGAFIPEE
ncbi:MAG: pyrroloquinoline-quinone synthase PqqC [Sneathiella sp.]|nr:pyrroloquinoline-quinone synthase PqqC [Sneathiella sp.]